MSAAAPPAGRPSDRPALIVFARRPRPGGVKTRLSPPLALEEAAALYEAFLRDALDAYGRLDADLRLYLAPDEGEGPEPLPDWLAAHAPHVQRGDGLGARMLRAFVETFAAGHPGAVVIGTDHPTLPLDFVRLAFEELREPFRIVLGPSDDGGYYLLGMNELYPALFDGMAYSHPDVFAQTVERAAATPAAVTVLPPWYDVDDGVGLRRLAADLAHTAHGVGGADAAGTRTRELVRRLVAVQLPRE